MIMESSSKNTYRKKILKKKELPLLVIDKSKLKFVNLDLDLGIQSQITAT